MEMIVGDDNYRSGKMPVDTVGRSRVSRAIAKADRRREDYRSQDVAWGYEWKWLMVGTTLF